MFAKTKATGTETTAEAQRALATARTRARERRGEELWRAAKRIAALDGVSREDCAKAIEAFEKAGMTEAEQIEIVGWFIRWNGADAGARAKMLKAAANVPILAAFAFDQERVERQAQAQDFEQRQQHARAMDAQRRAEQQRIEGERMAALKRGADEAIYRERVERGYVAPIGGAA